MISGTQISGGNGVTSGALGGVTAGAVLGPIGAAIGGGLGLISGITGVLGLGSSDPAKDAERVGRLNQAFQSAEVGDPRTWSNLNNMSGKDYITLIATNKQESGSIVAQNYAKSLLAQLKVEQVAGTAGAGLINISDIPPKISAAIGSFLPLLLVAAGIVVVVVVYRKRGS